MSLQKQQNEMVKQGQGLELKLKVNIGAKLNSSVGLLNASKM